MQLDLLLDGSLFLLQLFDLIRKLLPLIQQVADGIQIGSFVSIICRVQLIDLLCIRNIAKQYGWDLITPQNMADKFMKFIETMDMSYSYKPVLLKAIYEYMDTSGRVALPDVVDYFIDFYEDRKAHGMIAEKSTSIYQKGGYTRKDVEKNILSNPFKRFEDMRFLMRCKDVETIEVNPIIFRKLTREDWLHIVDVCDKSLEKYYLRLKK